MSYTTSHDENAEFGSDYLGRCLIPERRSETLECAFKLAHSILRERELSCVIVTGWSGALVGIPLADRLGLPITLVRKSGSLENCHSMYSIEGYVKRGSVGLFVDDCVASGSTLERVRQALSGRVSIGGVLLYYQSCPSLVRDVLQRTGIFNQPTHITRGESMLALYDEVR